MENSHLEEELNERARWLRIRRRLFILPISAALGALLCVLIYTVVITAFGPARTYRAVSKLYLTFAEDQDASQDYYNGATWTDLIASDPAILDVVAENLPEGTDLSTVKQEMTAEILTDIRLLTVTVEDADPERAEAVLSAVDTALVEFGTKSEVFSKITFLSSEPAELVTYSYRTRNAAYLGILIGALAGLAVLLFGETLDDAAYVPEDMERRYGLPVAGVLLPDGSFYGNTGLNYAYMTGAMQRTGLLRVTAGNTDFAALRAAEAVLVEVPFGVKMGTRVEAYLSDLRKQDVNVRGLLLTGADSRFLDAYYRISRAREKRMTGADLQPAVTNHSVEASEGSSAAEGKGNSGPESVRKVREGEHHG